MINTNQLDMFFELRKNDIKKEIEEHIGQKIGPNTFWEMWVDMTGDIPVKRVMKYYYKG